MEDRMSDTEEKLRDKVTVVVLGDLGHSPRMNYHALSLSKEGYEVNLVGFAGSKPQLEILNDEHITLTYMRPFPHITLPRLLAFVFKVVWQSMILFFTLLTATRSKYLLLQNPPGVPAMPVCWFYCFISRTKFFVDWHNYGYSILALTLRKNHPLVFIYGLIEKIFGKLASGGLCVTKAMKIDLADNWGITRITVLYDRPAERFHPITVEEKHDLFMKLSSTYPCFSSDSPDKTVFTERYADGRVTECEDRPALVVSSTSWTEDEDFSILFHALEDYEHVRQEFPDHYPPLIVAVTGKGPMKAYYTSLIAEKQWVHVAVITPWMTAEDYPKLLASADLGVCLHYSSSGLDLPMKVVDMFGSGLPVVAIEYPALPELVHHNENGMVFKSTEELANLLQDWFRGFPKETAIKETYYDFYKNIENFRKLTWHSCWTCNALPLFSETVTTKG
ncbi:chitobiosyldiphosphodolichol beta-mannosyltransferase-like [Eriocheir sinensis]|uniref:chitobiosyldiphosphodolichol beta-mannosyltransferase-like n=1 Tax=Eriocheir sinensis TaxID=95602 RepID=UPI0021C6D7DF|nr:chitobiosyldiphosphodolichol beta-mannosyltransferase-like [Eriocheir sinensis]XP_050727268.1 chitobiosyldiphosphodolichol beta-mannosyltransferase-like [Eriocheir sinensis]XP_050727353.1 chitobiosyldiphosphodolichol beta-mannosyltransferase-like [Eriocheir sinensis]XP_050727438.1 chitobiosyldiphosphodolichol beta-mannosyltransferase-like [Eriocheir sinensis]XP_050727520.1 chitobiosyldiphosphodolichol beta-mannosyltransferase-like [Eriocheir sinensis]